MSPRTSRRSSTAAMSIASSISASFVGAAPSVLPETDAPLSVILVRAGEHSTALVADELIGSREIVVKSVGPQIAGIRGISGATILGDGRIVIILDMGTLVRSEWRARPAEGLRATATTASLRWWSTTRSPCAVSRSGCSSATACAS